MYSKYLIESTFIEIMNTKRKNMIMGRIWIQRIHNERIHNENYILHLMSPELSWLWVISTAWKVSLFRVILVNIFPHLDWIWKDVKMESYEVSLRIQSKCRKTRTRITPSTDTFYAVLSINLLNYNNDKDSTTFHYFLILHHYTY